MTARIIDITAEQGYIANFQVELSSSPAVIDHEQVVLEAPASDELSSTWKPVKERLSRLFGIPK